MSGCCSDHGQNQNNHHSSECSHENHGQKMKTSVAEEQEPRSILKKIFWKIGKADAEKKINKDNAESKSCCH